MKTEVQFELEPISTCMGVADLHRLERQASAILGSIRDYMLSPSQEKQAPVYSSTTLAALCDINKARFTYLLGKGELPQGSVSGTGRSRQFSLEEVQTWVRQVTKKYARRPAGQRAIGLAIANFKGGSTKTTTTMTTAQGLSLRGYKVLVVDLDAQASLTALFGLLPELDVREEHTIMPYIQEDDAPEGADFHYRDLRYAVRKTYWSNLDLIPAANPLYGAEYQIPANFIAAREAGTLYKFWDLLRKGIEPLVHDYDVIIYDTPPALSYTTVNALMAADAILMPLPPKSLDFASSTQFWSLFTSLASTFETHGEKKEFEFINVLLSNVDTGQHTARIREWVMAAYDKHVMPVEIPTTTVTGGAAAQFGTVYDIAKWDGNTRTFARARQAYDNYVDLLSEKLGVVWARRANNASVATEEGERHEA